MLSITALLISNIVVQKQSSFMGLPFEGSFILFSLTYVLSDVFSEVYGYGYSRRISWFTLAMNIVMVLVFELTIALPRAPWYGEDNQAALKLVLGGTPRFVIASFAAFQLGDWLNDIVFQKLRKAMDGRHFKIRAYLSSIVGNLIDSIIFFSVAFIGSVPFTVVLGMIFSAGVLVKLIYELLVLPFTHILVKKLQEIEGPDAFVETDHYGLFG
jgi:uncharacterized integral membrane protein (TIGR00697 family)